jgi:hypothetical protein
MVFQGCVDGKGAWDMADEAGGGAAFSRERLGAAREATALARDILIALLVLVIVVRPAVLKSWLTALGVSKATIFGLELTPGSEKELAATIDGLKQQRDAAIFERNSMAQKAEQALREVERLKGADPAVTQALTSIRASVAVPASSSGSGNSSWVSSARQAIDSGGRWAVVYGGDPSLADAQGEMGWAARNGLNGAAVFNRQGSFRSVVVADSPEAADALLGTVRKRRADAYVVNMQTWCPKPQQKEGYSQCI